MNSSNYSFFLIPFLIAPFVVIVIADGSHSREEVVKPNEVKHGKNGVQAHDEKDKRENQSKPKLTVEIPPQQKSHGLPVRSPQESPSKNWKPPTSPRRGRGGNAGSPKKSQRKPMTFSEIPSIPKMETDSFRSIPVDGELITDDFVGGFHHVPTMDTLTHEVNKHDAMLKSQQDQIGATHRLATNANNKADKYQEANVAEHKVLRNYSHRLYKGLGETQKNMVDFHKDYLNTADSHNKLQENYDKFVLADKEVKDGINSKLDAHGTGIGKLQTELGTERGRITNAENAHSTLKKEHDALSTHVKDVVGKQLSSHADQLKENREEMTKMTKKDEDLEAEISRVNNLRKNFEEKKFVEHVNDMNGEFTKAHARMNGLVAKAIDLETTQKGHGESIKGLQLESDKHWQNASDLKGKIKTRKEEMRDVRAKVMNMPNTLHNLFYEQRNIDKQMMYYFGEDLPTTLLRGQKKVNEAQQAFLTANREAAEEARKNQEKVLEANEALMKANAQLETDLEKFMVRLESGFIDNISEAQREQEEMLLKQMAKFNSEEKKRLAQSAARKEERKAKKAVMEAAPEKVEMEAAPEKVEMEAAPEKVEMEAAPAA